jgi:hypothetical protein
MLAQNVSKTVYLGIFTDFDSDLATSLTGVTVGSSFDPINRSRVTKIVYHDANGDGVIRQADGESIKFDVQSSPSDTDKFDNSAIVKATIIYTDGTLPFEGSFSLSQTSDGHVFLVPWSGMSPDIDKSLANLALGKAPIESFTIQSVSTTTTPNSQEVPKAPVDILCFTKGTMILTQSGEKPVEQLATGDMIATKDHGMQELRWVGSTTVPATGDLAPIMIQKGAMGNVRNLRVSPQHRMLVQGWKAEILFGECEVLVTAKHLVNNDTIYVSEGDTVEYFHILFDNHQIIFANGIPSESFHPGKLGISALSWETREEILSLFPELREDMGAYGPIVRTSLKQHEAVVLVENPDFLAY